MEYPLVSVAVVTYNSSSTVLQTLDSINSQTYPNLELIISDDCSTDNTIAICLQWLEKHAARFHRVKLVQSKVNTGVSGNLNRAEDICNAEWVKPIAGDDILLPECISTYIEYIQQHPSAHCCFSQIECIGADEEKNNEIERHFNSHFFSTSPEEQLHELVFGYNFIPAVSCFYNICWLHSHGIRNDERIPMMEDWPKWINILRVGGNFDYINKTLTLYRTDSGISAQNIPSQPFFHSYILFNLYYRYPTWREKDEVAAAEKIANDASKWLPYAHEVNRLIHTKAYRLGRFLIHPMQQMKQCYQ